MSVKKGKKAKKGMRCGAQSTESRNERAEKPMGGSALDNLEGKPFYRRIDWLAAGLTFVIALVLYTLTLQPTVGLEDSGEFIVASDYLGVPHPPGYPIWTLLTWAFQWVFHWKTYHGYPNPAWAVNWFSAVAGALACGILTLLVSRSGTDLLRSLKKETEILGERTENLFCATAGVSAGLLLAFSQGMWSQAVIAEVYTLNVLFQTAVLAFLYRWMAAPQHPKPLFLMAFTFGLGLTNHQTLLFMGLAIALAIALRHIRLARDFAVVGVFYVLMVALNKVLDNSPETIHWAWISGPEHIGFWFWTVYAVIVPILGLFLPNGKTVCATYLLVLLGLSFYIYMPIASEQNPPMNWGYARTWEGFMHAITRGQYEPVKLASVFSFRFIQQLGAYAHDLRSQFLGPVALLAILPFAFIFRLSRKNLDWLLTTIVAFGGVGIIFIILQNPKLDIQTLFIARVQYIQSHAIYAIWLGYSLLLMMAFLEAKVHNNALTRWVGTALVFLLPFSLIVKNYASEQQLKVVGGSEQDGRGFGWEFGHWALQGIEGIRHDLWYYAGKCEETFERMWADYPLEDWPPPMGTNAIFFGGTDPGRFVPTYMIYSPGVRPDVYLITQNALADGTYMSVMRDLYGDQIWIPSQSDSNRAFQRFVEKVQSGKIDAGADVTIEDGRVRVQGVGGVMQINAILCRDIFDRNQYITEVKTDESTRSSGAAVVPYDPVAPDGTLRRREFFIEESYVIPWMYPYLTPHGLILKLNNEPTPITAELKGKDRAFWNWNVERLLGDRRFTRDVVARKTFSKLRSAIAGLYAARGHLDAAEHAFNQSVKLYPLSPEANFRLADLYLRQRRFDEALELIGDFVEQDRLNDSAALFLAQIEQLKQIWERRAVLEKPLQEGGAIEIGPAFELLQVYNALQDRPAMGRLVSGLMQSSLPSQIQVQLVELLVRMRQVEMAEPVLAAYLNEHPDDLQMGLELVSVRIIARDPEGALDAVSAVVERHGEAAARELRTDPRFQTLWPHPAFREMVPLQPSRRPDPGTTTPTGRFGELGW